MKYWGGDRSPLRSKANATLCYVNLEGHLKRLADNPWCTFLKSNSIISRGITAVRGPVIMSGVDGKGADCDIHESVLEAVKTYHTHTHTTL